MSNPTSKMTTQSYIFILVALLIGMGAGFFIGKMNSKVVVPQISMSNSGKTNQTPLNTLYTSQTAQIQGVITKISGNVLTVKNYRNYEGQVTLSPKVRIIPIPRLGGLASPSADLELLETGRNVILELQLEDKEMRVSLVRYFAPIPTFKPISIIVTPSPLPKR